VAAGAGPAGAAFLSPVAVEADLSPEDSVLGAPPFDPNRLPPRPPRMDPRGLPPRPRPLKSEDPIREGGLETTTVITVSRIFCLSAKLASNTPNIAHLFVVLESLLSDRLGLKVDISKLSLLFLDLIVRKLDKGDLIISLRSGTGQSKLTLDL
jgi:hypothetical protein